MTQIFKSTEKKEIDSHADETAQLASNEYVK